MFDFGCLFDCSYIQLPIIGPLRRGLLESVYLFHNVATLFGTEFFLSRSYYYGKNNNEDILLYWLLQIGPVRYAVNTAWQVYFYVILRTRFQSM